MRSPKLVLLIICLFIGALYFFVLTPLFYLVRAQSCTFSGFDGSSNACDRTFYSPQTDVGHCKACIGYNEVSQKYEYWRKQTDANVIPPNSCGVGLTTSFKKYSLPQLTNIYGCYLDNIPSGCNQAYYCPPGPSVTPVGGGGCDDPKPTGFGPDCPSQFTGDKCTRIPCSYRADCNCMGCCGEENESVIDNNQ